MRLLLPERYGPGLPRPHGLPGRTRTRPLPGRAGWHCRPRLSRICRRRGTERRPGASLRALAGSPSPGIVVVQACAWSRDLPGHHRALGTGPHPLAAIPIPSSGAGRSRTRGGEVPLRRGRGGRRPHPGRLSALSPPRSSRPPATPCHHRLEAQPGSDGSTVQVEADWADPDANLVAWRVRLSPAGTAKPDVAEQASEEQGLWEPRFSGRLLALFPVETGRLYAIRVKPDADAIRTGDRSRCTGGRPRTGPGSGRTGP